MNKLDRINQATTLAKVFVNLCKTVIEDPDKKERLAQQQCVMCYYRGRIGGSAMTNYNCGICGTENMHGSTAVPKLCGACAKENKACVDCGADLNLKGRRK